MKSQSRRASLLDDLVPRLKDQGYAPSRVTQRRAWVEERTGASLRHVGSFSMDSERMRGNIENPVGAVQVPIGVAGPLLVRGRYALDTFYIPLATTEGALVRSYERGMVALTRAGGVETSLVADENQISPSFFFETLSAATAFVSWVQEHFPEIKTEAEATTRHGKLRRIQCTQWGRQVIVNLGFETADAQGMNMIVKAADRACSWVSRHNTDVKRYFLFSGMCSEKRASGYVLSRGKGKWVTAGAFLPESVLVTHLNCTSRQLHSMWQSTVVGHLAANSVGYNGQLANGLAAMFIALGQDVANIANSACGLTSFELEEGGLYAGLTLPALTVATVGGGTGLATQRECLEMLGCYGPGKAGKLAEIVAAVLLGGELSMGSAIASGEFAAAHELYGRYRPRSES